jgi:hypothetical protein
MRGRIADQANKLSGGHGNGLGGHLSAANFQVPLYVPFRAALLLVRVCRDWVRSTR